MNLFDLKFPIYISTKYDKNNIQEIMIDRNNFKYLQFKDRKVVYDFLTDIESTYYGRLQLLSNKPDTIIFNYSFMDIAHLIYGWNKGIKNTAIIIDSTGNLLEIPDNRKTIPKGYLVRRKLLKRIDNLILVSGYYAPIKIPNTVIEILDTYKMEVELVNYQNTLYFRNIAPKEIKQRKSITLL